MPRGQGGTLSGFTPLSTPNAPTIDSVSAGIGGATVSFTAPTDTGDAAITSYIVTAVNESTGASSGVTGTSSPISLTPGGGTFKIRMQAVNDFGPGRLTEFDTGNVIYTGAELYTWGSNQNGKLGLGDVAYRSSPVQVGALTTWSQVAGGLQSAAALKTDGTLWSWGAGQAGRLGDGTVVNKSSPVQIGALTNWSQVTVGEAHCVAIKTSGALWAWGDNGSGQLGDGTDANRSSPVQVGALTDWSQVSAGEGFTVAVKTNGTLWSWGNDQFGRLGQNTVFVNKSSPTQIGSLTNWSQIGAGREHTGVIKTDGTLWAWGRNTYGQIGDNTQDNYNHRSSPVQVGGLTNWSRVFAGNGTTFATTTSNALYAWGNGATGRLGHNDTVSRSSPVQVGALTNWSSGSAFAHTLAVKTDGTAWAWGSNFAGQIGDGNTVDKSSPVQVGALTNWYQASAGSGFTHIIAVV